MSQAGTRAQAKRNTLLGQIGALILAGVAVTAFIVGVPGVTVPETEVRTVSDLMEERAAERARVESAQVVEGDEPKREVDFAAVAERLEMVHKVEKNKPELDTGNQTTVVEVPSDDDIELKYLGHIAEPNRQLALISFDGRQRIVPVGQSVSFTPEGKDPVSITVKGVSSSEVVYERDGEQRRVSKAPKVAGAVTQVASTGVSPPPVQSEGANPAAVPSEESDLDRRRREAMERRQRILDRQNEQSSQQPDPQSTRRPDREN